MEYEIGSTESVSTAVVRAVSALEGREPRSMPSLDSVVDPEALDSLCDPKYDGTPRRGGQFSFVFSGCHVTVDNGEYVTLELLADRPGEGDGRAPSDGGVG